MGTAIQELKLILSLDTKAYQAGLKGAKANLLGLTSAQVAFGIAAAQYAMKGIDAVVKQYKEFDKELDRLTYMTTDYNKVSRAALNANMRTTASFREAGSAAAIYGARLKASREEIAQLAAVTSQYADDTGESTGAVADSVTTLADAWGKDAGGMLSKLMKAGQLAGMSITQIAEQAIEATPYVQGMGLSFEELLAQIVGFKKAGKDYNQYIMLMAKNFDKFGGNITEAVQEIKGMSNTVRSFKTLQEAAGFLTKEYGLTYKAATAMASALRGDTTPEIQEASQAMADLADNIDYAAKTTEANISWLDRLAMTIKGMWTGTLNPTPLIEAQAATVRDLSAKMMKLKDLGYSRNEMSYMLQDPDVYSQWEKMYGDSKKKGLVAPGKVIQNLPSMRSTGTDDKYLKWLENAIDELTKYDSTNKQSSLPTTLGQPMFTSAAGFASDIGGSAASQMINDMLRVDDTVQLVAKDLTGQFRAGFSDVAGYADNAAAIMQVELVPAMDGATNSLGELANNVYNAGEGVGQLNATSEKTQSTWEKVAEWAEKAAEKMGIDTELLTNNIWTGLLRVGKESLETLGVDVDELAGKIQGFFAQAKGYGLDMQQFWEWCQVGTGQTTEQIWQESLDNMTKAAGNFIMQASAMFASGTMDWKKLFGSLFQGVLAATITAVAKMVAEWIAGLEIIAQAKAILETIPGVGAAIAIGALAVGAIAMLASKREQQAFASGGLVLGPTNALVGEAGPEAIFPLEKLNDLGVPYGRGGAHGGNGAPTYSIVINNPILNNRTSERDVQEFADRLGRLMVRKGGSLANSYS